MGTAANYANGLAIVGTGGLILSVDIPLIRLSESDIWTTLFVRGVLTFTVALTVFILDRTFFPRGQKLLPGRAGLAATSLFALSACTFVYAVFHTSAGNVVFLLAFNPIFSALLSWRFGGERPRAHTFYVMPVMLIGVALIVGSGFASGNWEGDLSALLTAFLTAAGLTVARMSRADMRYASAIGTLLPALVATPIIVETGLHSESIGWLILNGGVIIPVAMICLALGPMFVPAPVASMAYLIETVLAPLWIWWIFAERPTNVALIGGFIVIGALVIHSLIDLATVRRERHLGNVRRV